MTTSTNPTDDIIDLTEVVEEGIPLNTKFEDFAMDKAVDAKSLDQELDDLLRETGPKPEDMQITDDEIELNILFDEPSPTAAQSQPPVAEVATPPADAGMDMSDIDDLFDSLGIGEKENGNTALDILLDGDIPRQPESKTDDTFYPADAIDLELALPGTEGEKNGSTIHDLTDELLADIPETVLLHAPEETRAEPVEQRSAQEEPLELTDTAEAQAHDQSPATEPRLLTNDEPVPKTVLNNMPLAGMDEPEVVDVSAEQTAAPETGLSLAAIESISARLDALESRPEPAPLGAEELLALLPQSPQGWPVAQTLRQEILDHVESRISELASSSSMDGLQESVNALQSQVEAIPDVRSELAKVPAASLVQKMEAELGELKALVQSQDEALSLLHRTLVDKDAAIEALTADGKSLREELQALTATVNAAPAPDAIQSELRQYVQQQVPLAAAKIIREEIQALLKELAG